MVMNNPLKTCIVKRKKQKQVLVLFALCTFVELALLSRGRNGDESHLFKPFPLLSTLCHLFFLFWQ